MPLRALGALVISVRDLHVHYRAARAVDGVSLDWRPGEVLGVVGESGCGKSTLARAMLGLVPTAGGAIELDGEAVTEWRALRRRVQMVFQDPYQTLNPRMRVRAIVTEPLVVSGARDRAELVDRALADVGLPAERFADRYPHELSGGQRQRVAVARALAADPDVLICDEITSALDASTGEAIMNLLTRLREQRGMTLLLISHDLPLIADRTDSVTVLDAGRAVESGRTADVFTAPRHAATHALLGTSVPAPGLR
jgi:peptide/nickel transport system ATP-binding protein